MTYQCVPESLIASGGFRLLPELMLYSAATAPPKMYPSYAATTYTPYQNTLLKWVNSVGVSVVASSSTTPRATAPYGEMHRGILSFPVSPRSASLLPNPTCTAAGEEGAAVPIHMPMGSIMLDWQLCSTGCMVSKAGCTKLPAIKLCGCCPSKQHCWWRA
jgi:hypothetical protein